MTSHQTSRRPRPSRPSPGLGGDYDYDDGDRAPLGTRLRSALFRVPGKHGSIAAITVGCALFVAASIATPIAAADKSGNAPGRHAPHRAAHHAAAAADREPQPRRQAAPAGRKTLSSKPVHSTQPAPVTKAVITGLAANGIPNVALNAYRVAAARMANVEPSCGIDWALLAGIGREESDHGQFGGAALHADGVSTPPIIGPALDGVHWDYIPVSAQYISLAGDRTFAHALGPMQFIPSTWAAYGADANGDGKADIFNINDAALGAARYLCAAGGNLRTHAGQVAAVLAYNHSDQYLAQVLALAADYRSGVKVSGIPVGITTGALPTVAEHRLRPAGQPGPADRGRPGREQDGQVAPQAQVAGEVHEARRARSPPARTRRGPARDPAWAAPALVPAAGRAPAERAAVRASCRPRRQARAAVAVACCRRSCRRSCRSRSRRPRAKATPSPSKTCVLNVLGICVPI